MAQRDAREGKGRGNWRMKWVVSTLHTTSEHDASSITTADAHTSAASSQLHWRLPAYLNGLVHFTERWNLVSACAPSHFRCSIHIEAVWVIANAKYSNLYHDYLLFQYADRTWPLIILGIIMFVPGAYHVRIAYYAYRQYPGYSFDEIPEFDWSCGWRKMQQHAVMVQTFQKQLLGTFLGTLVVEGGFKPFLDMHYLLSWHISVTWEGHV